MVLPRALRSPSPSSHHHHGHPCATIDNMIGPTLVKGHDTGSTRRENSGTPHPRFSNPKGVSTVHGVRNSLTRQHDSRRRFVTTRPRVGDGRALEGGHCWRHWVLSTEGGRTVNGGRRTAAVVARNTWVPRAAMSTVPGCAICALHCVYQVLRCQHSMSQGIPCRAVKGAV